MIVFIYKWRKNAVFCRVCTVAAWKLHALSEEEAAVQSWLEANTFTGNSAL
jgi:hypothetical protein